ncbi:MAG: hypothetical protein VX899_19080 [Myxococcota bacterium]|nr:hypothetical protein [Myxococcota bacterium]
MKKLLTAALAIAALTGCYKIDYTTGAKSAANPTEEIWRNRVVFGIIELDETLALNEVCPSGVAKIHTERDIITGLITQVVGVIYAPSMIHVYCVDGSAYRATMDGDAVVGLEAPIDQELPEGMSFSEECAAE